jgi:hypothetical protein
LTQELSRSGQVVSEGLSARQARSTSRWEPRLGNGTQDGVRRLRVRIAHGKWSADVDASIAPLVLAIWRRNISTLRSSRDTPKRGGQPDLVDVVSITFASILDSDWFMRLVFDYQEEYGPDGWGFTNVRRTRADRVGGTGVTVRFRHTDYDFVLARITADPGTRTSNASRAGERLSVIGRYENMRTPRPSPLRSGNRSDRDLWFDQAI